MEFIFGIIIEFIAQALFELLGELGLVSIKNVFGESKIQNPFLSAIGHSLLGAIFGGVSLLVYGQHYLRNPDYRILNIIVTPIFAGLFMRLIGHLRERNEKTTVKLNKFFYGYLFALAFALIRFKYAV